MDTSIIPKSLDQGERFLLWDVDQIVLWVAIFAVGLAFNLPTIGLLAASTLTWVFGKSKSGKHPRYLLHLFYWYLPSSFSIRMHSTPPSYYRYFLL